MDEDRSDVPGSLFGPVDEVVVEEHIVSGSAASSQGAPERREVLRFDEGNLIEQLHFVPEDSLLWRSRYSYDENGRLLEWTSLTETGEPKWHYEYVYNEQGSLEREITRRPSGRIESVLVYEYVDGRVSEETMFGPDDTVQWRRAYEYSEDGRVVESTMFYADGTLIKHSVQEFDDEGRLERETFTNGIGVVFETYRYRYDAFAHPREVEVYDGTGSLVRTQIYEMDDAGNVQRERVVRNQENPAIEVVREYRYDRYGNWTQKRTINYAVEESEGEPTVTREKVVERTISYHPR
ncbi:MAG: hypothetical protein ACLFSV_08185 [Alkalispirochaeta sp.]